MDIRCAAGKKQITVYSLDKVMAAEAKGGANEGVVEGEGRRGEGAKGREDRHGEF